MDILKGFIIIISICVIAGMVFYITTPSPPPPALKHRITIDTHGFDVYYLTIKHAGKTESITVVNYTYSAILDHGEYNIEACYWNVNNTKKCEGQRIWLDEDLIVHFFMDVIE